MSGVDEARLHGLATGAKDGDRAKLEELLRALLAGGLLRPPIRRYLFAEDDVQLAEQQALVAISTKLDSWRGDSLTSWANQIAANEAKMVIRSRERRRGYEAEATNRTAEFVERMSSQLATAADVERCMAQLEVQQRTALELRKDGLSYRAIAERLQIPEGTVKTRVRMARAELVQLLAGGRPTAEK